MDIWKLEKWKLIYSEVDYPLRGGLRLRFDKGVNNIVKEACKEFCKWLRKQYYFPIRLPVYIARQIGLRARDGDIAMGTILMPFSRREEPYARIAAGNFQEEQDWEPQLFEIFGNIAHELTHYYQWINGLQYTEVGEERQAKRYATKIVENYRPHYEGWVRSYRT